VFVEVRMRKNDYFGGAADSVDVPKRARVVAAARAYLALVHPEPPCRFDVVTLDGDRPRWIRAAFDVVG
jgi:putative endonuclease